MGAIVLEADERKHFRIIDGQQRLATLSILILACIDFLEQLAQQGIEQDKNRDRAKLLETSYIGGRDPVSLRVTSKLALNANDRYFYEATLTQRRHPHGGVRMLSDSEKLLWNCFTYFQKRVAERFISGDRGAELARFVNEIVTERLVFISVRVRDQLSAYTVFETLNARGLELTETDLLKNYLLSLADRLSKGQMDAVLGQWQRITDRIGAAQFPDFLRYHLNSRQPYIREKQLFRVVKSQVQDLQQVFCLLDDLEKDAVWFAALRDHGSEFWKDYPGASEHVRVLELFGVKRFAHLVLAAKDVIPENVVDILRICMIITVRFTGVSRRSSHSLEPAYNQAALAVRRNPSLLEIKRVLRDIYIRDEEFRDAFRTLDLKSTGTDKHKTRYFLCALERQMAPKELSDETLNATIEHILPDQLPSDSGWDQFFNRQEHARLVCRLGNYTLLESKLNQQAGQADFDEKRPVYQSSQFHMTQELANEDEWTPARIEARQRQFANAATCIWRLDLD